MDGDEEALNHVSDPTVDEIFVINRYEFGSEKGRVSLHLRPGSVLFASATGAGKVMYSCV